MRCILRKKGSGIKPGTVQGALPVNDYQLFDKPILVAGQGIRRQRHTLDAGLLADLGLTLTALMRQGPRYSARC